MNCGSLPLHRADRLAVREQRRDRTGKVALGIAAPDVVPEIVSVIAIDITADDCMERFVRAVEERLDGIVVRDRTLRAGAVGQLHRPDDRCRRTAHADLVDAAGVTALVRLIRRGHILAVPLYAAREVDRAPAHRYRDQRRAARLQLRQSGAPARWLSLNEEIAVRVVSRRKQIHEILVDVVRSVARGAGIYDDPSHAARARRFVVRYGKIAGQRIDRATDRVTVRVVERLDRRRAAVRVLDDRRRAEVGYVDVTRSVLALAIRELEAGQLADQMALLRFVREDVDGPRRLVRNVQQILRMFC